jgi:DNA-binding MarR family transcriptional regulator
MSMNIPLTGEIGDLLGEVRTALIDDVRHRVDAAAYGDLRTNHDCVFRHLDPHGTRLRELATQSQIAPQSVIWHVDELQRLGYVERVPDPSDRRAKLIRPTEHGLAYMAAARDALADIEREWVSALGMNTLTQLRDTLATIRSLQQETGDDAHAALTHQPPAPSTPR